MSGTKTATLSLWMALTCMVGFGMFAMKNQVQSLEKELSRINASIDNDIKTIHVLNAEWSHLNSPARLEMLAKKHAKLNPVKAEQIIAYSALPFEYEKINKDRKAIAQKNIGTYAERNRAIKVLASIN